VKVAAIAAALLFATPLVAQDVGYPPSSSPYRDIPTPQRITLFGGYFVASKDKIGAIPKSAPLVGLRYEVTVGGPAQFFARTAFAPSKRNAYDPARPQATRSLGEVSAPLYFADIGFSFNLTGQKSWNHLVPTVGFGLGLVSSMKRTENDPFRLGTKFAFSTDFGVRYVPEGRSLEWRVNLGNTFYQTRYPAQYTTLAGDGTSLLPEGSSRSSYRMNWTLTAGLSYPIFR
jgi:hypothetical protein